MSGLLFKENNTRIIAKVQTGMATKMPK